MNTKIAAIILSLLMSGCASLGVNNYAKGVNITDTVKSTSTCTQVKTADCSSNYTGSGCTNASSASKSSVYTSSECTKAEPTCANTKNTEIALVSANTESKCTTSACTNGATKCTTSA